VVLERYTWDAICERLASALAEITEPSILQQPVDTDGQQLIRFSYDGEELLTGTD
jgi:hypothetical protein